MSFQEFVRTMPAWLTVVLGVLVLVQLTVEIWALVDLVRRPVEQVTLGKKWVWALLIVFVNLVGAIVYFVAGREPVPVSDVSLSGSPTTDRASAAADLLYGDRDKGAES